MVEPTKAQISFDPSMFKDYNPLSSKPHLIANDPISEPTKSTKFWPKNPRARERSLSRVVSNHNLAEHNMDIQWIASDDVFIDHLDESEKRFDAELVADMKRWNQEIVDSKWALNDLATPKQWPQCSRNMLNCWNYEGKQYTTKQELRREWPPLPEHRYRHFKYEHELICPESWNETHQRSIMVGNKLHPFTKIYHQQLQSPKMNTKKPLQHKIKHQLLCK